MTDKELAPIERAVVVGFEYLHQHISFGGKIDENCEETVMLIIKRELEKAVEQATASTHGSSDFVKGWNAHRKAMGLE